MAGSPFPRNSPAARNPPALQPQKQPSLIEWKYLSPVPKLIGVADETLDKVEDKFTVTCADGVPRALEFGQDITYGTGGTVPAGRPVSTDEKQLKATIAVLPKTFDTTGKAAKEFDEFLKKHPIPAVYTDPALDRTIASDENFVAFSDFALNAPGGAHFNPSRVRIHQALKNAGWNINMVHPITDLKTLAFNRGGPVFKSANFSDGLKIMINTVAHVFIFVNSYYYNSRDQKYEIMLTFELYDAFGLDDEDMKKFGFEAQTGNSFDVNKGFTAWWQLQHQFSYAPLVTKASVTRFFSVSTK